MLCIIYVIALGTCLGLAGIAAERVLPMDWPRRWVWCGVVALSMAIPPVYQARHASIVSTSASSVHGGWLGALRPLEPIVMRMWVIASALLVLWGAFEVWRVSRIVRRTRAQSHARETIDGVPVLLTDSSGPATVGVLQSNVLIPRWVVALPASLRRYVVYHEEEHRRARDVMMLFIASLSVILSPWNIAVWWQLRRLSLAVELDCDRRVVAALGNPEQYGELLLKVAQASSGGRGLQPGFIGGRGSLERRLTQLVTPHSISRAQRVLLPAVAIALLLLALWAPHPVPDTHAAARHASVTSNP